MSTKHGKLVHELLELIPVTLFFLVGFLLLALTQTLLLAEHGIRVSNYVAAVVGAIVVAKVVVIADHIPWVDRFRGRPLVYNVLWKSTFYFLASFVVRYAEHILRFWRPPTSFGDANLKIVQEMVWTHFWFVQIWLLVLLLLYCSLRELLRAIGPERVTKLFFLSASTPFGSALDASEPAPMASSSHVTTPKAAAAMARGER